jgi:hypothetical protein
MSIAQNNLQEAMNTITDWMKNSGFQISIDETVVMHICRKRIRNHEDPRITLGNRVLYVGNDRKVLGLTLDSRLSWKKHIDETRAKATKRLNILKSLKNDDSIISSPKQVEKIGGNSQQMTTYCTGNFLNL